MAGKQNQTTRKSRKQKRVRTRKNKRTMKKRTGKGGFLLRTASVLGNTQVQTYCCDSKNSDADGYNTGYDCSKSKTGQCNIGYGLGKNYKFRCYNNRNQNLTTIDEQNNTANCKYIAGITGKIGSTIKNVVGAPAKALIALDQPPGMI